MGMMDLMGLMGGADNGGMMTQIKSAGESFGAMARDMDTIKAQNAEIIDQLAQIHALLTKEEGPSDERRS
jgi:hypothetical protein